jgi:hypothetical protein
MIGRARCVPVAPPACLDRSAEVRYPGHKLPEAGTLGRQHVGRVPQVVEVQPRHARLLPPSVRSPRSGSGVGSHLSAQWTPDRRRPPGRAPRGAPAAPARRGRCPCGRWQDPLMNNASAGPLSKPVPVAPRRLSDPSLLRSCRHFARGVLNGVRRPAMAPRCFRLPRSLAHSPPVPTRWR